MRFYAASKGREVTTFRKPGRWCRRFLALCYSTLLCGQSLAQKPPDRPHVLGIAHVAVYVNDLNQARGFYKDFLGFAEPFSLHRPDGVEWIGFIKLNDRQYLELFAEQPGFAGQLNHVGITTDDVAGMRAYLISRGITIVEDLHKGRTGDMLFSVRDPDGHLLEIVQYRANSWTGQAAGKFMPSTRISSHLSGVGLPVASMPISLSFYRDILGFKLLTQDLTSGTQPRWVDLRASDGSDYFQLLLVPETPSAAKWKAASYIGFAVPDAEGSLAILRSRTRVYSYFRSAEVQIGVGRKPVAQLVDPDGAQIELIQNGTAASSASSGKP